MNSGAPIQMVFAEPSMVTQLSASMEWGNSSTIHSCRTTNESQKDIRKCRAVPCLTARVNCRWDRRARDTGSIHHEQIAHCFTWNEIWTISTSPSLLEGLGHKVCCGTLQRAREFTVRESQAQCLWWSYCWINVMILIIFYFWCVAGIQV